MPSLKEQTVLIVGRGSGLARAIAVAVLDAGGRVIAAGRDQEALSAAYATLRLGIRQCLTIDAERTGVRAPGHAHRQGGCPCHGSRSSAAASAG